MSEGSDNGIIPPVPFYKKTPLLPTLNLKIYLTIEHKCKLSTKENLELIFNQFPPSIICLQGSKAVSYTHLDVYKRQLVVCSD